MSGPDNRGQQRAIYSVPPRGKFLPSLSLYLIIPQKMPPAEADLSTLSPQNLSKMSKKDLMIFRECMLNARENMVNNII